MPSRNRYLSLVQRHRDIETVLSRELNRPRPDSIEIQRLKRTKLLLRDEIETTKKRWNGNWMATHTAV